jgi:hypothetical protein
LRGRHESAALDTKPKRARLPAFGLSAALRAESWQTGAWGEISLTSGRERSASGLSACPAALKPRPGATHSRPEVRETRPINPRAQTRIRSVRGCHEGCFRLPDTRAVICSAAPLPYPAAAGNPRHTGPRRLIASPLPRAQHRGPSAARCTEDNSVLCPESLARLSRCLLIPPSRSAGQAARQAGLASFTPAPHFAPFLFNWARAEGHPGPAHPPDARPPSVPKGGLRLALDSDIGTVKQTATKDLIWANSRTTSKTSQKKTPPTTMHRAASSPPSSRRKSNGCALPTKNSTRLCDVNT